MNALDLIALADAGSLCDPHEEPFTLHNMQYWHAMRDGGYSFRSLYRASRAAAQAARS